MLSDRVNQAAKSALAAQKYVSRIFLGIGWLDVGRKRWQRGQSDRLEGAVPTACLASAIALFDAPSLFGASDRRIAAIDQQVGASHEA
jgi:hypothetical protein